MADYKNLIPFIRKAEGGLSGNMSDSAHLHPSPCGKDKNGHPYHTNKGIQWVTFQGLASKGGYDANCSNFINMPDSVWQKVYKAGFWDEIQGDRINNQAIANTFVEMAWGSGLGTFNGKSGAKAWLRSFFKTNYNTDLTSIDSIVNFVNKLDEQGKSPELFEKLNTFRASKYKALNQTTFLKGWLNRLSSFYIWNKPYAISKSTKVAVGVSLGTILIIGAFIYKYYDRRK
jgi:lysozyme family protein